MPPTASNLVPANKVHQYKESASVGLTDHEFLRMRVDESKLYVAPLPIMSGAEDRDGELTNPDGLIDVAYKRSPVVYFNHLHAFSPEAMPIGTCETPDRKYDLHRTANGWDGGTLFHDKTALAEQTFALVVKGVIRGRSIGALDLDLDTYKPQVKRPVMSDGRIIPGKSVAKHHRQYEMVEFSWTAIPANAEIATMMKSILSQDRIEGRKLDNALKYTLKHLDLSNPRAGVCSAEKGNQVAYSRKFSQVFGKGLSMNTPVSIQFDSNLYTPEEALQTLRECNPAFVKSRRLEVDTYQGGTILKAVQRSYSGEVEVVEDDRYPGLQLVFAKSGFFSQAEDTEEEPETDETPSNEGGDNERSVVEQIIEQANGGDVKVVEKPAGKDGEPVEGKEQQTTEKPAEDAEKGGKQPYGKMFLDAFRGHGMKLLEMSGDAMEGLEPEMVEKCGAMRAALKAMIEDIDSYTKERYSGGDAEESEETDVEDSEDEEAEMVKKAASLHSFFGKHVEIPKAAKTPESSSNPVDSFMKGLFGIENTGSEIPKPERDEIAQFVRNIFAG